MSGAISEAIRVKNLDPEIKDGAREALQSHKKDIRFLADPSKSIQSKRKKLIELSGTVLDTILSVTIPILMYIIERR